MKNSKTALALAIAMALVIACSKKGPTAGDKPPGKVTTTKGNPVPGSDVAGIAVDNVIAQKLGIDASKNCLLWVKANENGGDYLEFIAGACPASGTAPAAGSVKFVLGISQEDDQNYLINDNQDKYVGSVYSDDGGNLTLIDVCTGKYQGIPGGANNDDSIDPCQVGVSGGQWNSITAPGGAFGGGGSDLSY